MASVEAQESDVTSTQPFPSYREEEEELHPTKSEPARPGPAPARKWLSELPRRAHRRTTVLPPAFKRAGTNVSQLNQAIWCARPPLGYEGGEMTDSGTSTSSDEEEEGEEKEKEEKKQKKKRDREDQYRRFRVGNENYRTKGKVFEKDGRLRIKVKDTSNTGYLAKALGMAVNKVLPTESKEEKRGEKERQRRPDATRLSSASTTAVPDSLPYPRLNIVIMVIGSRGDAQPFLKIGKVLKEQHGHRVRIATHPAFRDFVERDSGLEFFSVGGDPAELMAFMVKNPGLIPTLETVRAGDIGRRRAAMADMFQGFWRACIDATDDERDGRNLKMMGEREPFVADAIIANPPSFAHVHCAEALGVPLHLMFTFPYTPTQAFPHPLASIRKSNVDPGYTNFISYPLVEMMVWQGLGDLVNDFRVRTLGLDPVSTLWAPGSTYRLHVPFTYLWSPGLVPKPDDWGPEIDVAGFVFLDLAPAFTPPDPLAAFLAAGPPPVYIGFGSIVVDDPDKFTATILQAVRAAGVRALISKGWGGLGGGSGDDDGDDKLDIPPESVFLLDNTPHDWLFPKVRACVIHGGAGTTAMALRCGRPTMVVPFFGDQHFWGAMVANARAGPPPVPHKDLTVETLAAGIKYLLTDEAAQAAAEIAHAIEREGDGAANACAAFHRNLVLSGPKSMRCSILETRTAVWRLRHTSLRLSPLAADILVERGYVSWRKLRALRHTEWNDFEGPGEPVTGIAGSLVRSIGDVFGGIGGVPYRVAREQRHKREHRKRKRKKSKTQAATATTNAFHRSNSRITDNLDTANNDHGTTTVSEVAAQVGRGAIASASALARAPVSLSVAVVQGFHNAPRLYGDDTVRRPPRVTGIRSGLRAGGREFALGIYDGWTGLVRLPVRGARTEGNARAKARGLVAGVGMGITGFVLKNIAALAGPFGYALKGVVKEAEGRRRRPDRYVRRARIVQGQREARALADTGEEGERRASEVEAEVVRGWEVFRALWEGVEGGNFDTNNGNDNTDSTKSRKKKKKGGGNRGRGRFSGLGRFGFGFRHRKRRGLDAAIESVRVAERALAALRRGEDIEAVLKGLSGGEGIDEVGMQVVDDRKEKHAHDEHEEEEEEEVDVEDVVDDTIAQIEATAETPLLERENPFAHGCREIERNMDESRKAEEEMGVET